ncbi:hypothetical protein V1478_012174 [Vespula squamosa]|uniref:Uncharacterized protein n=1 Tax=Vespula squamosa TaxID=30214 RepID=A0ABD2ACG8_VESSQ
MRYLWNKFIRKFSRRTSMGNKSELKRKRYYFEYRFKSDLNLNNGITCCRIECKSLPVWIASKLSRIDTEKEWGCESKKEAKKDGKTRNRVMSVEERGGG